MELINRYIYAVIRRLPQAQREDIEKELRGLIEDMLSERCGSLEPKKSDIEAVLKELGEPSLLADKYRDGKRYLIGPEFFDLYILILKIVLGAAVFGVALGKTIELFINTPVSVAQGLSELISNILSAGFSAFAWVTIMFGINEHVRLYRNTKIDTKEWNPSSLPELPSKKAMIKKSEPIAGIIFSVLFIILFNFANQLFGVYHFQDGKLVSVVPIFAAEGLKQFMPLIIVLLCISILKECIKLIIGKWTLFLGIASAALNLMALVLCAIIFTNPAMWNAGLIKEIYASGIVPAGMVSSLGTLWSIITKGFIYFMAFGFIIDSIVSIYKGIKYRII